jgi:cytochrome b561
MKLLDVNGHLIVIFVGIPLIAWLVMNLRDQRIEILMKTNIDKLKLDIDALIQIHKMTDFSKGVHKDPT